MANPRSIRYAINRDDGLVISRVGREVAWPVLDFEKIGAGGDFTQPLDYNLEKHPVSEIGREWALLVWTRFVPTELKNKHRVFWGMPPLPVEQPARTLQELCATHRTRFYYVPAAAAASAGTHTVTPHLFGICHGEWGSRARLYHWFRKTRRGFLFVGIDDERQGAQRREIRAHAGALQHSTGLGLS